MALIFFGPRKLPQISRSLGKSLAEFRKASEDFKRTWEREVALETSAVDERETNKSPLESNSMWGAQARQQSDENHSLVPGLSSEEENKIMAAGERSTEEREPDSTSKRDWL